MRVGQGGERLAPGKMCDDRGGERTHLRCIECRRGDVGRGGAGVGGSDADTDLGRWCGLGGIIVLHLW